MGLFSSLATHYDEKQITDPGLWHLANPRRKYHSSCGYTHAGTDAVRAMRQKIGGNALASAKEIRISVPHYTFRAVAKAAPPTTPTESRFHLPFAAALAAIGEDGVRPEHGRELGKWLAREDLQAALSKITIVVDERFKHYEQCAVDVVTATGESIHLEGGPPRGAPANPMTASMVKDKFRANVAGRLSKEQTEDYIALAENLDTLKSCDPLYAPFVER
jgi:2-methylcitrate dehydratase PrpD